MPDSLFDKLDTQGEIINQVAEKLDGVSIEDLYALAKRTWDYKDYEMAQKYYNHISLLRPLDWKAPFCASLCGCLGPYETYFIDTAVSGLIGRHDAGNGFRSGNAAGRRSVLARHVAGT